MERHRRRGFRGGLRGYGRRGVVGGDEKFEPFKKWPKEKEKIEHPWFVTVVNNEFILTADKDWTFVRKIGQGTYRWRNEPHADAPF